MTKDAGKTTITERLLFHSGLLETMGEVHHGTTVMDFLEMERQRGITIQSACVSFVYRNVTVNLIDTPGHIDFNFEVERSLRVLDGALVIVDAVKGVEAQTLTVVRQANHYKVPKLFIFNKMDQLGADYSAALADVEAKLALKVLPIGVPVENSDRFIGCANVLTQRVIFWTEISSQKLDLEGLPPSTLSHSTDVLEVDPSRVVLFAEVALADLREDSIVLGEQVELEALHDRVGTAIEEIVTALADRDPQFLEDFFNGTLHRSLPRFPEKLAVLFHESANELALGLPCSALKYFNVKLVMDALIDFLPPPRSFRENLKSLQKTSNSVSENNSREKLFTALARASLLFVFKRSVDPDLGHLAFSRVYAGTFNYGLKAHAVHGDFPAKLGNVFRVRANELSQLKTAEEGDIVCVVVPENVKSGDYLLANADARIWRKALPAGYTKAKPVYLTSLGFENSKEKQ